ncbi:flavin reductase family protein [Chryseolinea sp. H1M3-3]|uniref:flavin reductase family protein n=1 Tax=Chryseolinea sp. H1M3-3 TaxID=3034144 RepID=UPI0023EC6A68|nr:flavin reductase family protein [Chryseolinea sp. H1M3-3]
MIIDPTNVVNHKDFHDLLLGTIAPRPIALASTVDAKGNVNLSPFSFFNIFSSRPPILVFSPSRRQRDNTTKHTLENMLDIKEVVINTVNYAMVEQISLASAEYPKGINEFVKSGLTPIKSERVKPPRVKESPASFECRVLEIKTLGTEGGSGNLVTCEVLLVHTQEFIYNEKGKVDPRKVDSVARMGGDYYCRINGDNIFELPRPVAGIGVDQLPDHIRNSPVLTGNNLGRLASIDKIPMPSEVKSFAENFDYNLLWRNNGGNRIDAIHNHAQLLLDRGEVKKAWLLLLSASYQTELWN